MSRSTGVDTAWIQAGVYARIICPTHGDLPDMFGRFVRVGGHVFERNGEHRVIIDEFLPPRVYHNLAGTIVDIDARALAPATREEWEYQRCLDRLT